MLLYGIFFICCLCCLVYLFFQLFYNFIVTATSVLLMQLKKVLLKVVA